jgi:hypothetical protein
MKTAFDSAGAEGDSANSPLGLLLPVGIVQPFDLRFASDEIHVIAYFQGHPTYEAVEAMIQKKGVSPTVVRAILTRHDQTQVDHVNDRAAHMEAQSFDGRETVYREIEVDQGGTPQRPCVTVRFLSFAEEAIQLFVLAASPPDAARGGLTDPGGHSPNSSLPLMWRGKSCLAGRGTSVLIDEKAYEISERVRSPQGFVGLNGFYTETHQMGAVRASTHTFDVIQEPLQIATGSSWVYAGANGEEMRYVIIDMSSSDGIVIASDFGSRTERIWMRLHKGRLRLLKVERLGCDALESGFTVRLLPHGRFAMDVANNQGVVVGSASMTQVGDVHELELRPVEPRWAEARKARIRICRVGTKVEIRTTVG